MNNQEKYQLWLNQYKAIQSSGLSIERWAIQNNLPPSTVYSRIHRLRLRQTLLPDLWDQFKVVKNGRFRPSFQLKTLIREQY